MHILIAHTRYQIAGGEGVVVHQEADMLREHGHTVTLYERSNAELHDGGALARASVPLRMTWARDAAADVRNLIAQHRPDVMHVHNTHFTMSPSVIHAAADAAVPVVKTLHNFRLVCAAGTFFRDGAPCEQCLTQAVPLSAVVHACYRHSRAQTAALVASTTFHRARGTWSRVAHFITPTAFAREKFIAAGFDPQRVSVKPHFLQWPAAHAPTPPPAQPFMLFVGRFSAEKGALFLLRGWESLPDVPLKMVGDGPLMGAARDWLAAHPSHHVELLGRLPRDEVQQLMAQATALVFPSECYETFGLVAVESFAVGTPVIAVGHGAAAEIVQHGHNGLHFTPAQPDDLAAQVRALWTSPQTAHHMGQHALHTYRDRYTQSANYPALMAIYERAMQTG